MNRILTLTTLLLALIFVTVYFNEKYIHINDLTQSNFASISSSSIFKKNTGCYSETQVKKLQSDIDSLQKKINDIPSEISLTTRSILTQEQTLKKARENESIKKTQFSVAESEYNKLIVESKNTQKIAQAKSKLKQASSTLAAYKKARVLQENSYISNKKTVTELKSGQKTKELTNKISEIQNSIKQLQKKEKCPSVESTGSTDDVQCRDLLDNDMNGQIDCEDTTCRKNTLCVFKRYPANEYVTVHDGYTIEKCNDSRFEDKESCEGATITIPGGCFDTVYDTKEECEEGKSVWKPETVTSAGNIWRVTEISTYKTKTCSDGKVVPANQSCPRKASACQSQLCSLQSQRCTSLHKSCYSNVSECLRAEMSESECKIKLKYEKDILSSQGIKISN